MADGDGETDVYDISGNGKGVAINIFPDANTGDHGDIVVTPSFWSLSPNIITPYSRSFLLSSTATDALAVLGIGNGNNKIQAVSNRAEMAALAPEIVAYFDGHIWPFYSTNISANTSGGYAYGDTTQAVYVLPLSDTSGASGARVRQRDGDYVRPEWFGAVGDGVTDDTAAFVAMRTLCGFLSVSAGSGLRIGPSVKIGLKTYYLASSFSCKGCTNSWIGEHAGADIFGDGSTIKMASGATFFVDRADTELGVYNATPAIPYGGDGTQFHRITFRGPGKGVGTANAFEAHATHYAYNCRFVYAGGHGCRLLADHADTGSVRGNCNSSRHYDCNYQENGKSGLAVGDVNGSGGSADVNDCRFIGGNFAYNTEYGVDDGCFLGNTYFGHFAGNGTSPFRQTGMNQNSRFGGYIEGPPAANATLNDRSTYDGFGGLWVNGAVIGAQGGLVAANPGTQTTVTDGTKTLTLTRGAGGRGVATNPYVDELYYTDFCSGSTPFTTFFRPSVGEYVMACLGYSTTSIQMAINGNAGTRRTHGLTTAPTGAIGLTALYLGDGSFPDGRKFVTGSAAPTTGEHAQGEWVFNNAFTATGNFAWVNTSHATPGTWQALYALTSLTITSGGQIMSTGKVLGRTSASTGAIEELGGANGVTISAGNIGLGAITPSSAAIGGGTSITKIVVYSPTLTPSSVAAATIAEQTYTVTGLTTADKVIVNPPAIGNATGIAGARVSATDTLAIRWVNPTAGALTPTSGMYQIIAIRS